MKELLDPILLPHGVHVGYLLFGYGGEVQVHLHNKTIIAGLEIKIRNGWYRISEGRGQKIAQKEWQEYGYKNCGRSCKLLRGDFKKQFKESIPGLL